MLKTEKNQQKTEHHNALQQTQSVPPAGMSMKTNHMAARMRQGSEKPRAAHEPLKKIKQTLASVYVMLGIRPDRYPEGETKQLLHQYILQNGNEFSLQDIENAIVLYMQEKLDFNDPFHYFDHTFSVRFLEKVMRSYKRYKDQLVKPPKKQLPERRYTKEEIEKIMRNGLIACFERYRDKKLYFDPKNVNYDYLNNLNLIGFTSKVKHQILEQAEKKAAKNKEAYSDKAVSYIEAIFDTHTKTRHDEKTTTAKDICLLQIFDFLIENKKHITYLLKNGVESLNMLWNKSFDEINPVHGNKQAPPGNSNKLKGNTGQPSDHGRNSFENFVENIEKHASAYPSDDLVKIHKLYSDRMATIQLEPNKLLFQRVIDAVNEEITGRGFSELQAYEKPQTKSPATLKQIERKYKNYTTSGIDCGVVLGKIEELKKHNHARK